VHQQANPEGCLAQSTRERRGGSTPVLWTHSPRLPRVPSQFFVHPEFLFPATGSALCKRNRGAEGFFVCLTILLKTSLWKVEGQVARDLPSLKIRCCSGRLPEPLKHAQAASWLPSCDMSPSSFFSLLS